MKLLSVIFLGALSYQSFSQEIKTQKNFHFGAMTHLNGVTRENLALNVTFFGEYRNHQLGIGSYYNFFNRNKYTFSPDDYETKLNATNFNAHYRFYAINKGERFRTFVQLTGQFEFLKKESNFVTTPNSDQQLAYGPIFTSSFNAQRNYSESNIGVFIGIGEEVKIVKGLFANAHLAFGIKKFKSRSNVRNLETNLMEYNTGEDKINFGVLGSIGVGYRF